MGSYSEKGDAFVALSMADTAKSAREIGEETKRKVGKSKEIIVQSAVHTTINQNNAYLLRLKSEDKKNVMLLELLWIEFEGNVFSLAGAFAPPNKQVAHQALCISENHKRRNWKLSPPVRTSSCSCEKK